MTKPLEVQAASLPNYRAVLLVSGHRDDRRVLFNTFDMLGFDAVYTARETEHAQALLVQDPKISLIVLDFADSAVAAKWCEKLAAGAADSTLLVGTSRQGVTHERDAINQTLRPILGVLPAGSEIDLARSPSGVVEWLRSPISANELKFRLKQIEIKRANEQISATTPRNAAAAGIEAHALLWDSALANSLNAVIATRDMWEWTDQTVATLELDLLMVLGDSNNDEPSLLAAQSRLDMKATFPAVWEQEVYRRINTGETIAIERGANDAIDCPVVKRLKLQSFIGIPLVGDKRTPIGTMLLGSQRVIGNFAHALKTAQALAQRFALEHLVSRYRYDSRFHGLHDGLTRLPNRILFNDRLENSLAEAARGSERLAVVFVDLDRFKTINDSLGHNVGDQVLTSIANRLRTAVRASDTVCRYAGDEFVLLLRHVVSREDVGRISEKLLHLLEAPLTLNDGSELHLTASVGVAFFPEDGEKPEELIRRADAAMYGAKGLGRNRYQFYLAQPEESQHQRIALEAKLRQAERNQELRSFYQPKVDTLSEDIIGMEALIRWEHPELGLISPGFFIPLAEETGLIVSMGEWILRTACIDAKIWHERFGLNLKISVNLSALQLKQKNLLDVIERALNESQLPPQLLDLEVTESINVKDIPNLMDLLASIRRIGCSISIDDFGTGQSSLEYLKKFPADYIKIDQTFVRNIGLDPGDEAIIRATIDMAHNLGLKVIAEGVETEDHLKFLRAHQCEQLQGFLFSRPLPARSFEKLLAEREKLLKAA
jgi:diguanylate cyclase (GGDEF)-like protein